MSASTSLTSAAQELSPDLSLACTSGTNCITGNAEQDGRLFYLPSCTTVHHLIKDVVHPITGITQEKCLIHGKHKLKHKKQAEIYIFLRSSPVFVCAWFSAFWEKDSESTGVSSFSKWEHQCALSASRLVLPKRTPLMIQDKG